MSMNAAGKPLKSGEIYTPERNATNGADEVVLTISSEGTKSKNTKDLSSNEPNKTAPMSSPSAETGRFRTSPSKPPKPPTTNEAMLRRRSLMKQKSRFGEQPLPVDSSTLGEETIASILQDQGSPYNRSPANRGTTPRAVPVTPSPGPVGGDDDGDEIYKKVTLELSRAKRRRVKTKALIEWITFGFILACLICSLTVKKLQDVVIWSLSLWKWWVLVMVIFSGLLVTNWITHLIVFLIEKNFLLKKKVLYFVHGLKKSVQVFVWLTLVLITWVLMFKGGIKQSELSEKILYYVTWTLVSILIGSFLWFLKTLFLKILASNFHVTTFFDRIQDSIFHHYVLQTLSGPPLIEEAQRVGRASSAGQFSFRRTKRGKAEKEKKVIDMGKIHKMKRDKVSAWTMKMLVDAVMNSGLPTISNTLDESVDNGGGEQPDNQITNDMEAMAAAYHIFRNVAQPGCKYFDEDDLLRFLIKEEVDLIFPLFEGWETGRIDLKSLRNWVIKVFDDRRAVAHALTDTKTAVKQLNKLVTGILIVVTIILWLLLTEIATTKALVLLSSQLLVAAFIFKNMCKTIFEAIIFVFVMHPFDVGDRCVIDGVPLLVEEMNILTTVFLKLDFEKVYYPNSVLATKPISNYRRSPDMGDKVDFSIDFMTPMERIGAMKERIKKYLDKNPAHWHENYVVVVSEIENVNKIKISLIVNHKMNFQDYGEKTKRKTELVLELKRIFEELNIKYNLVPQEVHVCQRDTETRCLAI
ncbi:mechanosensitive ion channel protein 10-like [Punica granatum]|uniref:Mechanosensitive ion channel protein n=1 Tax=Punica granatum TaxID=22663 RepID=A0A6P8DAB8_PUNGR|nr:mechanosensitive ion channel protein 10-like [Punica granatum]XP_031388145.1 mechanosensitive ion channel protein 10-like [Punica granatum]XP_031388153.1 mechanosensitive ion channel protein 10-like [Punica granatum]